MGYTNPHIDPILLAMYGSNARVQSLVFVQTRSRSKPSCGVESNGRGSLLVFVPNHVGGGLLLVVSLVLPTMEDLHGTSTR